MVFIVKWFQAINPSSSGDKGQINIGYNAISQSISNPIFT